VGLTDGWATSSVPKMVPALVDTQVQNLKADGTLDQVRAATWVRRMGFTHADRSFAAFLVLGFALYAGCAFLRVRFSAWPIHPVIFLVWYSYPLCMFGTSFLIGWIVKTLVVKLGGARSYQGGKPFMMGLIAGDLLGGLVFMVAGALYYAVTGFPPKRFGVFPS
jgi:hypothetical protein